VGVARNQEVATEAVLVENLEQVQLDGTHACVECGLRHFETSAYSLEINMETEGNDE
jgi:hypothetical protein